MSDVDSARTASRLAKARIEKRMRESEAEGRTPFSVLFADQEEEGTRVRGCRLCGSTEEDGRVYIAVHAVENVDYMAFGTVCSECDPNRLLDQLRKRVLEIAAKEIGGSP